MICTLCNNSIEHWLGRDDYCFACLNDQDKMDAEFADSIEPIENAGLTLEPIASPQPNTPTKDHVLQIDTTGNRSGWNKHVKGE